MYKNKFNTWLALVVLGGTFLMTSCGDKDKQKEEKLKEIKIEVSEKEKLKKETKIEVSEKEIEDLVK
ncbi:MAG: hypothetical protein AAFQ01_02065, partial [Bacteroidota bacterium]